MKTIDIVFDGPPGPDSPRFVEVEDGEGKSIAFGTWIDRKDGFWVLRIPDPRVDQNDRKFRHIETRDGIEFYQEIL